MGRLKREFNPLKRGERRQKRRDGERQKLAEKLAQNFFEARGANFNTPIGKDDFRNILTGGSDTMAENLKTQQSPFKGHTVQPQPILEEIPVPKKNRRGRKSRRRSHHPLRDIRLQRGFTLEELSDLSGLSPSYLSRLESGSRRLNVDTIEKLSKSLSCEPSSLLVTSSQGWSQKQAEAGAVMQHQAYAVGGPLQQNQLPVYGALQEGGPANFRAPMGMLPCPPELTDVPGAFAYCISDDRMAPRYRRGDYVLAHPGKPLSPQSTAIVMTHDQGVIVGEFVAWRSLAELNSSLEVANDAGPEFENQSILELRQYQNENPENLGRRAEDHPKGQIFVPQSQVISISRVVGMIES